MSKRHPAILAGLDLGTAKTAAIMVRVKNGSPQVVGVGVSPTVGMQKGSVNDLAAAAITIRQALEKAEKMAGEKATSAYIGYNRTGILIRDCQISRAAGEQGRINTVKTAIGIPTSERLLALMPPRNIVSLSWPGTDLQARAITCDNQNIESIIESARLAGIVVQDIIYSPLAAAKALLSPFEREFGTLMIDIGATTVTVSIHDRGLIRETAVLSIGGEHLVSDLAIGLRISMARAGEVLKQYQGPDNAGKENIEIDGTDETISKKVSGSFISSIIEARIKEIFHMISEVVISFNYPSQLVGGAVLYGGVAQLDGLTGMAEKILQLETRIGAPQAANQVLGPNLANAFGLAVYGSMQNIESGGTSNAYREPNGKIIERFYHWFQDKFKMTPEPFE
ncbi:MAG: cell division FtsA domain-containing protein [Desulfotomaculaceae bacterium]|nr:cell division FtsA domain-containing protein [Desulfotomaculaceae bacterium]